MLINNDGRLESESFDNINIKQYDSKNYSPGWYMGKPKGIAVHYTAWDSANESAVYLSNPNVKVSTHFIIDRNGDILQLISVNNTAWHAARPYLTWRLPGGHILTNNNPNDYFIGLDFANVGYIADTGGKMMWYFDGKKYTKEVKDHMKVKTYRPMLHGHQYWEQATDEQMSSFKLLVAMLIDKFGISKEWIVDHHYIDPTQKVDCVNIDWKQAVEEIYADTVAEPV